MYLSPDHMLMLLLTNEEKPPPVQCEGRKCSEHSSKAFCCIYLLTTFHQSRSSFCVYLRQAVLKRRISLKAALHLLSQRKHLLGSRRQEAPVQAVQAAKDKHDSGPSPLKNRARSSLARPTRAQRQHPPDPTAPERPGRSLLPGRPPHLNRRLRGAARSGPSPSAM